MSLIPVQRTGPESLAYDFDVSRNIVFSGAHGEEIVRDVFYDMHVRVPGILESIQA